MNLLGYILLGYLLAVTAIGLWYARKSGTRSDFYLAGRGLKWPVVGATIAASTIGGSATIVTAKMAYVYGLPALNMDLFAALGLIALSLFMAGKVREMRVYSLPEMGEQLFGRRFRIAASVLVLLSEIAWVSLLIQATMFVISLGLDIDTRVALVLSTVVFIAYTLLGGQKAVSMSDVLQLAIMVAGIVFIALPAAILADIEIPQSSLRYPTGGGMDAVAVVSLFFLMFLPHLVGPDIYSKVLSARTPEDARIGTMLAGIVKLLFGVAVVYLGMAAAAELPGTAPAMALPAIVQHLLPEWLAALVLAALVATMMSSADTCLLTGSTVLAHDLVAPLLHIEGKKEVMVSRASVVLLGLLSLYMAILLNDIVQTLVLAYTVFAAGIILPLLAGMYADKTKVTANGATAGLLVGGVSSLAWMYYAASSFDPILVGMALCLVTMAGVSFYERSGRR